MLPDAYWDALLLQRFPGKTLEELDAIDWPRLIRAWQAKEIEQVEEGRRLFFEDKYQPTRYEWRLIRRHDRLEERSGETEHKADQT